jgi:hypothetical protein
VLRLEDFPPGWRKQEPDLGLALEPLWSDLARCLGLGQQGRTLAVATSPTWLRGLATQAVSTVEYVERDKAGAIAAALDSPERHRCTTEAFDADARRSGPEGGVPGPSSVTPLDFPNLGERVWASRVNVVFKLDELEVPVFQDFLVIFDGDAVTRFFFLNPGSPFPPELERTLVGKVVERA